MRAFLFFFISIVIVSRSFSSDIAESALKKMHLHNLSEFSSLYLESYDYDISLGTNINSTIFSNPFTIMNSAVNIYCQENCEVKIINSSFQLFNSSLNFYGINIFIQKNNASLIFFLNSNSNLSIQVT